MSIGQLVGRVAREALDRHDPSRSPRRGRTSGRPADANAGATRTPAPKEHAGRQRGAAALPKAERPAACDAFAPKQAVRSAKTALTAPVRSRLPMPRRFDAVARWLEARWR